MPKGRGSVAKAIRWLGPILALMLNPAGADATPRRVVSANLCTDQLALLLAAPGQLVSVSRLAADPALSNMPEATAGLILNHGRAEEIFHLRPDLVVAGTYTTRAAVDMLRRLGVVVELFAPDATLADSRSHIRRMGQLLGQEARAQSLLARFDADQAGLAAIPSAGPAPIAAPYYTGGRSAGRGTLVGDILSSAGWRNLAAELGITGVGILPLEQLVFAHPNLLLTGASAAASAPSQSQRHGQHPALAALRAQGSAGLILPDRQTICGGPAALTAALTLAEHRRERLP